MARDLIAVVGVTCTGKGALALALGEALGGPSAAAVVVCDSAKIYRGADVGTGKLLGEARRGFSFYMVDIAEPGEQYNAGRYMEEARRACDEIWREGKTVVVVGGTGLYVRALLDGICEAPPADAEVRASLSARQRAGENLHRYLAAVDGAAAARITPADTKRIVRALEVYELTGVPLSAFQRAGAPPLATGRKLMVALDGPRPWLAARIDERTARMVAAGLRGEVEGFLARGLAPPLPPLNAIGYRQLAAAMKGEVDDETAIAQISRDTRRLAKRQRTWFKKDPRAAWMDAAAGTETLAATVLRMRAAAPR